ncbi:MAG: M23 family metallopeptidase [Prevotella sp.]|nr:M23 family metallopeptidase [Prevotella sp.]
MKIRHLSLAVVVMFALSSCAQTQFTALEQQQISISDPTLFEKSDAFTIDFSSGRDRDYSFPLPAGKAKVLTDYTVEIETARGDAVKSMFAGVVRLSKYIPSYGHVIVVRHGNGLETVYGNNAQNLVKSGDRVKAGQTIAIVGTEKGRTFCRFAIMVNGSRINPSIIFSPESHQLRQQVVLFQKTANWKVNVSVMKEPVIEQPASVQWWSYPLLGAKVISPFGSRGGRRHTGVDLKTVNKDEIHAAFDGEVVFSGPFSGYGNLIRLRHDNGLETYYSHNSKNLVKVGEQVKAGQIIALTGQTGRASTPHLHFETRIGGQAVNPNRFFDHEAHTIRLEAFNKKRDGYVIKR